MHDICLNIQHKLSSVFIEEWISVLPQKHQNKYFQSRYLVNYVLCHNILTLMYSGTNMHSAKF